MERPGAAGTTSVYPAIVFSDFDCLTWGGISLLPQAHGCDSCDANV